MITAVKVLQADDADMCLRGRTVSYDDILNDAILSRAAQLRPQFVGADPFPHIVLEGLFSPDFLEIIRNDFARINPDDLDENRTVGEVTFRSRPDTAFPTSAQIYFDAVNSCRFTRFLTELTGIEGLITDCSLMGGGLHESRNGGKFDVHVDFNKHPVTHLDNRLVLLTYLNHNWREDFGGALELWSGAREECVVKVVPEFGRSVIMRHSDVSWHGHPTPIQAPDNRPRRSLATYYYTNGIDDPFADCRYKTRYLGDPGPPAWQRAVKVAKHALPPVLFSAARKVRSAMRSTKT